MSIKYYKLKDGRISEIDYREPEDRLKTEWPSEIINRKPSYTHRTLNRDNQGNIFKYTATLFFRSQLTVEVGIAFLHHAAEYLTHKLDSDWTSYRVTIGSKGEVVNPLSVLEQINSEIVELSDSQMRSLNTLQSAPETPANVLRLIALILSIYRIGKAVITFKPDFYRQKLTGVLNSSTTYSDFPPVEQALLESYDSWANNAEFRRIVAAFDMYLNMVESRELSFIRVGSLVTSFEDCQALQLSIHYRKLLGLTIGELTCLILYRPAFEEFDRMYSLEEETDKKNSYLPYCRSMEIVGRSPWSITANKNVFLYFTTWGTIKLDPRSYYALAQEGVSTTIIFEIVTKLEQALGQSAVITQSVFGATNPDVARRMIQGANQESEDEEEQDIDAHETKVDRVIRILHSGIEIDKRKLANTVTALESLEMRKSTVGDAYIKWAISLGVQSM